MKSLSSYFSTSPEFILEVTEAGIRVTLHRADMETNPAFKKAWERHTRDIRGSKKVAPGVARRRLATVYAEAIVRNWETQVDTKEDGTPVFKQGICVSGNELLPYNEKNVADALFAFVDLYRLIEREAANFDNFRALEDEGEGDPESDLEN